MVPELQQLSLLIEHADNVPDHLMESSSWIPNTFCDVLRHRDLINKSLSRLQGIVSGDDFGEATVEWFSELIHRVLGMVARIESKDKSLKGDPKFDLNQLTELTKAHEDVLKKQRSLTYTLDKLNEKFEELSFICFFHNLYLIIKEILLRCLFLSFVLRTMILKSYIS